jgi:uncharacterized protein (DUF1800 family)
VVIRKSDVAHLLRRAGFGGTAKTVSALVKQPWPDIVDTVLNVSANPPVVKPPELSDPHASEWDRWVAVTQWWFERMRTVPAPIQEKMVLFWHGHFCSSQDKVFRMDHMWDQNQLFRTAGLGDFENLAQRMAIQPAMLIYLDNYLNVLGVQQENFARELMELFTLSVGNYSQDDVVASARAWTGYGLTDDLSVYRFRNDLHDKGKKTFMGVRQNWSGPDILHQLLSGAATRQIAARFIAKKLWSFFAYPDPDSALLDSLQAAFLGVNLDITAMLRIIFNRPEFLSPAARGALVRSPIEFVAASLVYTGVPARLAHPEWWVDAMGQAPFYPPDVSGWKQNAYWISSSSYWARAGYVRYLTWLAQDRRILAGTDRLTPAAAVTKAFDTFNIDSPSATTRAALEAWITAERAAHGWAEQPNLITLSMLTPEFQLA